MSSTFFGLNIGTTGLYTYQAALNTTSHNVSNAETKGYTRQILNQKAGEAIKVNSSYGMAGTGVDVSGVTQERDEYYDIKYWKNSTLYGEYSTKNYYMTQTENYFNEVSLEGFTTSFNSFYDNLQELSKNVANTSVRTQVTNYAKSLTEYFNFLSTSMQSVQEESNFEVKNKVDQINSIGKQVASLTKQINTIEVNGQKANDLRDQRALLVDELSEIANVTQTEKVVGDGIGVTSYTVKINGQTLVDSSNYNTLKLVPRTEKVNQNDVDGLYDIEWSNGQTFNASSSTLGGTLQALFEVRDGNNGENLQGKVTGATGDTSVTMKSTNINEIAKLNIPSTGIITVGNHDYKYTSFDATYDATTKEYTYKFELEKELVADATNETSSIGDSIDNKGIPYYMDKMNEFIRTFSKSFNEVHRTGQDLNGNKGLDFFNGTNAVTGDNLVLDNEEDYYSITAANFTITNAIYTDPKKLALAAKVTDGVEDKKILESLIALKNDKSMFNEGAPASFLQALVAEVGIDADTAATFSKGQGNILKMINNQRLSISGVDTEEEAMNLIRYKNAYNLCAQVISTMNEIYDKLINEMGV